MGFNLLNIISIDKYNFLESKKAKAFSEINKNDFPLDYSLYRLRYFVINLIVNIVFNSILFYSYYKTPSLDLFYIHLTLALILQFWWGSTNLLTRKVKNEVYFDNKPAINKLLNEWLANSFLISLGLSLVMFALCSLYFSKVSASIIIFILIRFIFKFIYRVFYSLVFALNRVFIPFYYTLLTDFIFVMVIYFSAAHKSIYVNLLLLLISFLNFVFFSVITLKQAKNLNLIDIGYIKKKFRNFDFKPNFNYDKSLIILGISALALSSNLFLLFNINGNKFYSIFLMLPFLIACQAWIKPFYFDLTDNKILLNKALKKNYLQYLFKTLPFVIIVFFLIYKFFCYYFTIDINQTLLIFMIVSSIFSIFIYDEFSKFNTSTILIVLACEILLIFISKDFLGSLQLLIIFRGLGIAFFTLNKTTNINMLNGYNFVITVELWHELLTRSDKKHYICIVKFNQNIQKTITKDISKKIALFINNTGKVAVHGQYLMIYSEIPVQKEELVRISEGSIVFYKEFSKDNWPENFINELNELQPSF